MLTIEAFTLQYEQLDVAVIYFVVVAAAAVVAVAVAFVVDTALTAEKLLKAAVQFQS